MSHSFDLQVIKARCEAALAYEGGTIAEALQVYHDSVKDIPALIAEVEQLRIISPDASDLAADLMIANAEVRQLREEIERLNAENITIYKAITRYCSVDQVNAIVSFVIANRPLSEEAEGG